MSEAATRFRTRELSAGTFPDFEQGRGGGRDQRGVAAGGSRPCRWRFRTTTRPCANSDGRSVGDQVRSPTSCEIPAEQVRVERTTGIEPAF